MPVWHVIWTSRIIEHLAEHGVRQDEFMDVMRDPQRGPERSDSDAQNKVAWGFTRAGRWLMVVYTHIDASTILPVTAYEPEQE